MATFVVQLNLVTGLLAGTGSGSAENFVPGARITALGAAVFDVGEAEVDFSSFGFELQLVLRIRTLAAKQLATNQRLTVATDFLCIFLKVSLGSLITST
jgi:hypothetical protein